MRKEFVWLIILYGCLLCLKSPAQSVTEVLNASSDSLAKIKIIQYKVTMNESVPGLPDKNLEARIVLERSADSLFGMKFLVYKDSSEYIFDGRNAIKLDHGAGEVIQLNPAVLKEKEISDLLVKEFFRGYEKEAYTGKISGSHDSLTYYVITWITNHEYDKATKRVYINRLTGIPEKFESTLNKKGKKEVTLITLTALLINRPDISRVDTRIIGYLDEYTLLPVEDIGIPSARDARDSLVGKKAPEFLLKTLGGQSVKLSDFKGKLVLLDFWEVWCGPCRMSMPHLQELHDQYKEKGLVILGITKDNVMAARGLLLNRKITYENLVGTEQVTEDYKVLEIPQYYLIGRDGVIVYISKNGFEKKLEDTIGMLLK